VHNGWEERLSSQYPILSHFYSRAGSKPMVYALGNKGADLLSEVDGIPRGKVDWTAKNHTLGPLFLEHTLLVSEVMVAMRRAGIGRISSSMPTAPPCRSCG